MWFLRRARLQVVELSPPPDESVRVLRGEEAEAASRHPAFNAANAVARIERFVGTANATVLQLEDRIGRLEAVVADLTEELHGRPTHSDVLDVRLQAARIDGDVKRLATELRAEVAEIKDGDDADALPSREERLRSIAAELHALTQSEAS